MGEGLISLGWVLIKYLTIPILFVLVLVILFDRWHTRWLLKKKCRE